MTTPQATLWAAGGGLGSVDGPAHLGGLPSKAGHQEAENAWFILWNIHEHPIQS